LCVCSKGIIVWIWCVSQKAHVLIPIWWSNHLQVIGSWGLWLSDFINGLINWWIYNLMALLGGAGNERTEV
jgi:hypothetical protein